MENENAWARKKDKREGMEERERERERGKKTTERSTLDISLENEEENAGRKRDDSVLGRASLSGKLLIP